MVKKAPPIVCGVRLSATKDKDIIEDLLKYSNQTARWKEAYRIAMKATSASVIVLPEPTTEQKQKLSAIENFAVLPKTTINQADTVKNNIMNSF